jgi:hypothetical protein
MAIKCTRCGGTTMPETVINLRRGILGFRETRWQGGYCATCKLSVPVENPATMRPLIATKSAPFSKSGAGTSLCAWLGTSIADANDLGAETTPRTPQSLLLVAIESQTQGVGLLTTAPDDRPPRSRGLV